MLPHEKEEQADPQRDGRVGNIESGPVVSIPVDVDKIYDLAQPDAIDKIAHGTGKDKGQGENKVLLVFREMVDVPENGEAGDSGYCDKKGFADTAVGEKTKGRSLIADRGYAEKIRDDPESFMQGKAFFNIDLGQLIQGDDYGRHDDQEAVSGRHVGSSHPFGKCSTELGHDVGTTLTNVRMPLGISDGNGVVPASFAFFARRLDNADAQFGDGLSGNALVQVVCDFNLRNNAQGGKLFQVGLDEVSPLARGYLQLNPGVERMADELFIAGQFQCLGYFGTDGQELVILFLQVRVGKGHVGFGKKLQGERSLHVCPAGFARFHRR